MADFPIAGYSVTLGRVRMPGMSTNPDSWAIGGIRCGQGASGQEFLDIAFMPEGVALPANTSNGNWHTSYRPASEMGIYIDILRSEKPLRMSLDSSQPERHRIGTTNVEPVGEAE